MSYSDNSLHENALIIARYDEMRVARAAAEERLLSQRSLGDFSNSAKKSEEQK